MKHLLLPAKIIGVLWIIFSIGLSRTPKVNSNQAEFLIFAINVLGISSIAFLYGHSRGKKGLNASWIGKVFIILCASLPLLVIANKPWMDTVMNLAFSTVFVALTFYLPYRAGSKLGYREYEAAEDKAA